MRTMENAGFAMPSIMVVDDEKDILIILEHYLRHRGYYFSTYSDPITKRLISRMHSSWSHLFTHASFGKISAQS
jgi:CheY-like chemotaxis protein